MTLTLLGWKNVYVGMQQFLECTYSSRKEDKTY
jgi:hypothetical protein